MVDDVSTRNSYVIEWAKVDTQILLDSGMGRSYAVSAIETDTGVDCPVLEPST